MRWVLSRRIPDAQRILLIESGKREVAEKLIPHLRRDFGEDVIIDLLTCLPGRPENLSSDSAAKLWRVTDFTDDHARWRLLREIRGYRHSIAAVLYDDLPIMARWRLAALCLLPAKFLIANENADYFWLDRAHFDHLVRFWMHRSGLLDESAVRTIAQFLAFPFVLIYLAGYAAYAHTIRLGRMALGQHRR
jgi:hypothetical protein